MNGTTLPGDIPWVDAGGERRMLAAFHDVELTKRFSTPFAARYPTIPRSEWKEVDLSETFPKVKVRNQGNFGSCVGQQYRSTFAYAWLQGGGTYHEFSATFIYALINGGVDRGAFTGDSLKAGRQYGICLESEFPEGKIYSRDVPPQAYKTAERFKNFEAYWCPSFDEIMSAAQLLHPVGFGIEIGQRFEPDARGVIPDLRGQLGGHDMCVVGCKKINGHWHPKVINSWGENWGLNGFCFIPESYFQGQQDDFALVANAEDPQDPNAPPEPK